MTDVATQDLDAAEARELTDRIKGVVAELLPLIVEAWRRRVWAALGFASWEEYCDRELRGLRLPVERREAVTQLRREGMSTPAIGAALRVSDETVRTDLQELGRRGVELPTRVVGLDGRSRPAQVGQSRPAQPEPYVEAVQEFPELAHFEDHPGYAVAVADQLRSMEPDEQDRRRANLGRYIDADSSGRLDGLRDADPVAEILRRADGIFTVANTAAREITRLGGPEALATAIPHADPLELRTWREQFAALAETAAALESSCEVKLRRVQ